MGTNLKLNQIPIPSKSMITLDIKPYEADTNLDKLALQILKIKKDGLIWNKAYKITPLAFGMYKLMISCTIEDNKIRS